MFFLVLFFKFTNIIFKPSNFGNGYSISGLQMAVVVKNTPAKAEDVRDVSSIPRWGRFSGGENGNPLQSSCLGNPMDRGTWQATVYGIAKESGMT